MFLCFKETVNPTSRCFQESHKNEGSGSHWDREMHSKEAWKRESFKGKSSSFPFGKRNKINSKIVQFYNFLSFDLDFLLSFLERYL